MSDSQPSPTFFDNIKFPLLSDLPFRKGDPPGAIWGFYEHLSSSSSKDQLGALNLLTPSHILRASRNEIKIGKFCSVNWEVHKPVSAAFGRKALVHRILRRKQPSRAKVIDENGDIKETYAVDDEIDLNTQCGSQWDGFKHYSYYNSGQFYNGLYYKDVLDEDNDYTGKSNAFDPPLQNSIHSFQAKIVGRGVLLDFYSFYSHQHGKAYEPCSTDISITAHDLEECAKFQGVTFEQGDILFVRMGFVRWYEDASKRQGEGKAVTILPQCVGIRQTMEEVQWFWDHHFSAVASDSIAFEAMPGTNTGEQWSLHDYLLALWGTPIGELFDFENLSQTCQELGRYSFFVTSSPLNVVNGIASPPNAMAIF